MKYSLEVQYNDRLKAFLNHKDNVKLFLTSKKLNNHVHHLGWFFPKPILNRDGFRSGSITPYHAFKTHQSGNYVNRVLPQSYTSNRMAFRSTGELPSEKPLKICMFGVGSVGSHFIYHLESLPLTDYILIDPDILTLENTGRHLLGFEFVNRNKVEAMKKYLTRKDPRRKVESHACTSFEFLQQNIESVKNCDYIFLVIGKQDAEEHFVEVMKSKQLSVPTFIIWVEPYLFGGHCIFLHPDAINYEDFFFTDKYDKLFKYNVVAKEEYLSGNEILSRKEASCQTTFIPYSDMQVKQFTCQLFAKVHKIITTSSTKSTAFTWVGDLTKLKNLTLKTSDKYINSLPQMIFEH